MNRETVLIVTASAVSTTVGVVAGALAMNKRLEKKYEAILSEETQKAKDYYAHLNKADYPTPEDAVLALVPIEEQVISTPEVELFANNETVKPAAKVRTDYAGAYANPGERKITVETEEKEGVTVETTTIQTPDNEVTVEEVTVQSVFVDGVPLDADDWDLDAEMESRRRGEPYVIDKETYDANETDADQFTFTYFRGDDTVVDERDQVLERVKETLGDRFMTQFGFGSGDRKTVYIRNEKDGADYEVILHEGGYGKDFMGYAEEDESRELRHSAMRRGRRDWDG